MKKLGISFITILFLSPTILADSGSGTFSIRAKNNVKQEVIGDPYVFTIIPVVFSVSQCPENNGNNAKQVMFNQPKTLKVTSSKPGQKQVCLGYLTNEIPSNSVYMNN